MITSLKPYDKIIDSREPWLGEIPSHWSLIRTKALLNERSEKGYPNEPMLAATQTKGVVRKEEYENRTVLAMKDFHLLKLVREGDFVISLRSFQGGIEYAREQGIISPAYTILYPKNPNNHAYLSRLFKSRPYIENLTLYVTGIRQGQNIDYEKLSRSLLPFPPLSEQTAIVRYLDYMDRLIQRYIRAKQKQIRLLQEQKQAIIHQAVTRGLNPEGNYKPTGAIWLDQIPVNWKILPLKRWVSTKITDGPHETPALQEFGVPFMSAESMVNGRFDFSHKRGYISTETHEVFCKKCRPQIGDIFMCKSGATTGKVAQVESTEEFSVWSPLALIRVNQERVLPRLLFYILQSKYIQEQVRTTWSFGTQQNLSMAAMERISVAIPPIEEQKAILHHLIRKIDFVDDLIQRVNRKIDIIQEYRTRLIADVVTGKLDVREAAAGLPEELAAPDLEEETGEEEQDLEQPQEEGQEE